MDFSSRLGSLPRMLIWFWLCRSIAVVNLYTHRRESLRCNHYKMPRYRREHRAIAAVNFGATGIIGVAEV